MAGLLIAIVLVAVGSFIVFSQNVFYQVLVGDESLGYVSDPAVIDEILQELIASYKEETGLEVSVVEEVTTARVNSFSRLPLLERPELEAVLSQKTSLMAHGIAVVVDGDEVLLLRTRKEAEDILEDLKAAYIERITAKGNTQVESVEMKQEVSLVPRAFSPDQVVDPETAVRILERGSDAVRTYVVARGDTIWTIARNNGLTVEGLIQANPQVGSGNLIHPGDRLNLVVAEPYITFTSVETYVYTERIPFSTQTVYDNTLWPWQRVVRKAGVYGKREISVSITRDEGKETGRTVISQKVLSEPEAQVVVQGTKEIPDRGTGSYVWPTSGGTITSGYGWRRGEFHQGIDIAAPWGTSVKAADSGVVTSVGWRGGYGLAVVIDHGKDRQTLYAHLSSAVVKVGDFVDKAQLIAKIGNTGRSTGPHLHFEVHIDGRAVNPIQFYP